MGEGGIIVLIVMTICLLSYGSLVAWIVRAPRENRGRFTSL